MHLTQKKHLPKRSCYFAGYFAACLSGALFLPLPGYGTETSNGNESTYSPEQYINAANGSKNDNMPLFNLMNLNNVSMPPTIFFTATSNDPLPAELHSFTSDNTTTVTTNGVEGEAIYTPPTAEAFFRVGATVTLSSNASDMHELGVAFANGELGGFWIGGNTANQNYYDGGLQSVTLKLKTGCFGHLKHLWRSDDWSMSILQDAYMNITPVNAVFNKSNWYLNWSAGANNNLSKFTNPFTHENCSIVGCDHYGALGENTYSIVSGVENVSTLSADRITFNKSAAAVTSPVTIKIASAKNPAWNDTINIFPQYIELYQGNWDPYNLPNEIYVPFADGDLNNNGLIDSSEASLSMNLFSDLYRVKVRKLLHKSERNILFSFMPKASTIKILDGSTLYRALNNAPIPVKFQSSSSEFAVILLRYFPTTLLNAHYDLNYNDNPTVYEAIQGDNVRTTSNKFAIDKPDYYEYLELNDQVTIKGYGVDLAYPALLESSGSGVNASVDTERYIGGEIRVANPGRPAIIGTLTASSLGNLEDFVTANQTKNYTLSLGLSGNGELIPPANAENFDFINIPNPIGGGAFSFKATSDSISKRSIEAILSLNENGTAIHQDKLKLTALRFDVDIDSNGDGVIRCEYPTAAESEAISNGTATPEVLDKIADEMGKMNAFVPVNAGDKDGDGIADVNDYQISSATFNENVFKAVQITLPQSIQRSNYKIYINQPSTAFQLWKKPSNVLRTAADKVNSGYYNVEDLPSTLYLEAKQAVSSPIQIDFTLQPITNKVPSSSSTLETLDLAAYPAKLPMTESIAVWSDTYTIDLDIDSDNNNGLSSPERSANEDMLEQKANEPGKILFLNNLDKDLDGVPDYADGFDISFENVSQEAAGVSGQFVPVVISVSNNVNLANAKVKFKYSASDPAAVSRSGAGTVANPYVYSTGGGALRLWTKDGTAARKKASVAEVNATSRGDFIPNGVEIPAANIFSDGSRTATLYLEALSPSTTVGDKTITATLLVDDNAINYDSIKSCVVTVNKVTPDGDAKKVIISRLTGTVANAGDLISATDDAYYLTEQTEDRKVNITAELNLPLLDIPVYFEVVDPDDMSPYEGKRVENNITVGNEDFNPNDNMDGVFSMKGGYDSFQSAALSIRQANSTLTAGQARATTTLTITEQYSGDNYIVRAICQPSEPTNGFDVNSAPAVLNDGNYKRIVSDIAQSANLVAWKRCYIEHAQMYKKGATIITSAQAGATEIFVDSNFDFLPKGSDLNDIPERAKITFFDKSGNNFNCNVTALAIVGEPGMHKITIDTPLPRDYAMYSGIKLQGNNEVYANDLSAIPSAFGGDAAGIDGGAFIEFKDVNGTQSEANGGKERTKIPKYNSFDSPLGSTIIYQYGSHWRKINNDKILTVFAAKDVSTSIYGLTYIHDAMTFIFSEECGSFRADVTGHETGHFLKLFPGFASHVDINVNMPSNNVKDCCLMSYNRNRNDEIIEFCIFCLNNLRK